MGSGHRARDRTSDGVIITVGAGGLGLPFGPLHQPFIDPQGAGRLNLSRYFYLQRRPANHPAQPHPNRDAPSPACGLSPAGLASADMSRPRATKRAYGSPSKIDPLLSLGLAARCLLIHQALQRQGELGLINSPLPAVGVGDDPEQPIDTRHRLLYHHCVPGDELQIA